MRTILASLALGACIFMVGCEKAVLKTDTSFARATFISLAKGDTAVQNQIDMGTNVGAEYNLIPTEKEKQQFRLNFITEFASSFRQSGGSVDNFTNWKVTFSDSTRTEVTADSPNGLLTLTVSERDSVERVSSIGMIK